MRWHACSDVAACTLAACSCRALLWAADARTLGWASQCSMRALSRGRPYRRQVACAERRYAARQTRRSHEAWMRRAAAVRVRALRRRCIQWRTAGHSFSAAMVAYSCSSGVSQRWQSCQVYPSYGGGVSSPEGCMRSMHWGSMTRELRSNSVPGSDTSAFEESLLPAR